MKVTSRKIKILAALFALCVVISMIGGLSANNMQGKPWRWDGYISINGGPIHWQNITLNNVQEDPRGLHHTRPIHFNVKEDGYPTNVKGIYHLKYKNGSIEAGRIIWDYFKGVDGAVVVDDFIAHGYKGATWHFVWVNHKLILSDYYDAYPLIVPGNETPTLPGNETPTLPGNETPTLPGNETPTLPGNETPTLPGNNTNATVPLSGEDTIPMQNTGLPITPLVIALISMIGALLYPRKQ